MKNTERKLADKKTRKPRRGKTVTLIIAHEFAGGKTLPEALIPVISEDLMRKAETGRTFGKWFDSD
ncbi:MAG: stage II sporulation protein R [Oscillospiraceae bacterium]|jgi:hypothetical protein|nr:stage II sporulation protein R [Oscillospiraceae bacterium]